MPRIPSPIMFCLDPNDENLILSMPSEPTPDSLSSEQDNTPKKVFLWNNFVYRLLSIEDAFIWKLSLLDSKRNQRLPIADSAKIAAAHFTQCMIGMSDWTLKSPICKRLF